MLRLPSRLRRWPAPFLAASMFAVVLLLGLAGGLVFGLFGSGDDRGEHGTTESGTAPAGLVRGFGGAAIAGDTGREAVEELLATGQRRLAEGRALDAVPAFRHARLRAESMEASEGLVHEASLGLARALMADVRAELEWATVDSAEQFPRTGLSPTILESLAEVAEITQGILGHELIHGRPLDEIVVDPATIDALYLRNEVLSAFHLRRTGRAGWTRFLAVEPLGPRAERAREVLASWSEPTLADRWEESRADLRRALERGDRSTIEEIVAVYPHSVQRWAFMEGFPEWAEAEASGRSVEADDALDRVRWLGEALDAVRGARLVADSATAVTQARVGSPERAALVEGHRALGAWLDRYDRGAPDATVELLERAEANLGSGVSPAGRVAELYLAIRTHHADVPAALPTFERLVRQAEEAGYPTLAGHSAWMLATTRAMVGSFEASLEPSLAVRSLLAAPADPLGEGGQEPQLVDIYRMLGQEHQAFGAALRSRAWASTSGVPRRDHVALSVLDDLLLARDDRALALLVAAEMVAGLDSEGVSDPQRTETWAQLGRCLGRFGGARALEAFERAREHGASIRDPALRLRLGITAELGRAEALLGTDPRAASEALREHRTMSRAHLDTLGHTRVFLERKVEAGYLYDLTRVLPALAAGLERAGDVAGAEEMLTLALDEHERLSAGSAGGGLRRGTFARARPVVDALVDFHLRVRGDATEAFRVVERSQGRELRAMARRAGWEIPVLGGPEELVPLLPEGAAVVVYRALSDRLVAWVVEPAGVRLVETPVERRRLLELARVLSEDLAMGRRVSEPVVAELRGFLIEPLGLEPPESRGGAIAPRIVVPDPGFAALPFEALLSEAPGARSTVQLAPSASYLAAVWGGAGATAVRSEPGHPVDPSRVLVVSGGGFDRARHPDLAALPGADAEARRVAAIWGTDQVLLGAEATPAAVLARLEGASVVHFVGHTLRAANDPGRDALVLAPDGRQNDGLENDGLENDGRLTAEELLGLDLSGVELVVLSGCQTLGVRESDQEVLDGPAAALLVAGVGRVVGSRWDVEDGDAARFMERFHGRMTGSPELEDDRETLSRLSGERAADGVAWGVAGGVGETRR